MIQKNSDSGLSMTEIARNWLNQKIDDDAQISDLNALCHGLGINPLKAYNRADLANLRALEGKSNECAVCRSSNSKSNCFRYIHKIVDGHIKLAKQICNLNVAYKLIYYSGIPDRFKEFRAPDFKTNPDNRRAVNVVTNAIKHSQGVFIYGAVGKGKTFLSSIIVIERAFLGKPSRFYTVTDMLDKLRNFDNNVERLEHLTRIKTCPCLVIDDLGAENVTDWVSATLFEILDARYKANLMTVINSNLAIGDLTKRYSGLHGDRIVRRIKELCTLTDIT